ncbi:MAG: hypothetical protein ABSG46_20610 [Candidatus Binataceae bacterium]|jgi:hypothetical protein
MSANRNRRPTRPQAPKAQEPKTGTELVLYGDGKEELIEGTFVEEPETNEPETDAEEADVTETAEDAPKRKRVFVLTPYQAAKIVNRKLIEAGIEKVLPPQMLYTYRKQGKFTSLKAEDGRYMVEPMSFLAWCDSYIARVAKREAEAA